MLEFLETTQSYFNRYINASELLESLEQIDTGGMADSEQSDFSKLISNIKNAIKTTDGKKDQLINDEIAQLEATIERMEAIKRKTHNLPKEVEDYIANLREKRKATRDNLKRWTKIGNAIKNSAYYQKAFNSLSDLELLELIAADICATYPVEIDEDKFNDLIRVGIEQDKREWLWRLAFNYLKEPYNIDVVADYYLDMNDCFYLTELISIAGEKLNIDDIVAKVNAKDREFIEHFIQAEPTMDEYISKDQFKDIKVRIDYSD